MRNPRSGKGLVGGLLIIAIGVIFLLDQRGIVSAGHVFRIFWPAFFIFLGLEDLLGGYDVRKRTWGAMLIAGGTILLLSQLGFIHVRIALLWPLILIAVGVWVLLHNFAFGGAGPVGPWFHGWHHGHRGPGGPGGPFGSPPPWKGPAPAPPAGTPAAGATEPASPTPAGTTAARFVWLPGWRDARKTRASGCVGTNGKLTGSGGRGAMVGVRPGLRAAGHAAKWIRFLRGPVPIFRHLQPRGEKHHGKKF